MSQEGAHISAVESGSYPARPGCAVSALVDGLPAFERICRAVEAARERVWLTVAFHDRDFELPGKRGSLFEFLSRAADRGVDVRVIFWRSPALEAHAPDAHFHGTGEQRELLRACNASFAAVWDGLPGDDCQHQKSWLVDAGAPHEVAFVGGINLDCASLAAPPHPVQPAGSTHDVYLEVRGPAATDVQHNFVQRWNEASHRHDTDGAWPEGRAPDALAFPTVLSPAAGGATVQITRTVQPGRYRDATPAVGYRSLAIEHGEASVYAQYIAAIDAAERTIYLEDQVIGSPKLVGHLQRALERGVRVIFVVPGECHPQFWAARRNASEPARRFFEGIAALGDFEGFTLAALATSAEDGSYQETYVHSKLMIVDDEWATIGSTNTADQSFKLDTEMNASVWASQLAEELRRRLFAEHVGGGESVEELDAYRRFAERARANTWRRLRGERLPFPAYALEVGLYGLGTPKKEF